LRENEIPQDSQFAQSIYHKVPLKQNKIKPRDYDQTCLFTKKPTSILWSLVDVFP
jgi:hypothetical protein